MNDVAEAPLQESHSLSTQDFLVIFGGAYDILSGSNYLSNIGVALESVVPLTFQTNVIINTIPCHEYSNQRRLFDCANDFIHRKVNTIKTKLSARLSINFINERVIKSNFTRGGHLKADSKWRVCGRQVDIIRKDSFIDMKMEQRLVVAPLHPLESRRDVFLSAGPQPDESLSLNGGYKDDEQNNTDCSVPEASDPSPRGTFLDRWLRSGGVDKGIKKKTEPCGLHQGGEPASGTWTVLERWLRTGSMTVGNTVLPNKYL